MVIVVIVITVGVLFAATCSVGEWMRPRPRVFFVRQVYRHVEHAQSQGEQYEQQRQCSLLGSVALRLGHGLEGGGQGTRLLLDGI